MLAANFSTVRKNFKGYCDTANNDLETVIITRKEGGNAVLMSEAEYNNIMENLFVRSNKETYSRLKESINQLEQGQAAIRNIDNDE
ncbi:type II toxin-antitoxin system Phd/YefM family antitoxin [Pectinatus brassicae]|uniref:Antitoxin n=1 Tax=Pectinatus brassicae TaxID=862415 RepID=A0A840UKG9_9FIRM|nr:type II toxin-antitoxin system Phd/YefM family antitoxin [Pectinatus brassicae]MBB5337626.1 antitoxin YefM [Pectinatus brassicae]